MLYRGVEQRSALLVPPSLANSTCGAVRLTSGAGSAVSVGLSFGDVAQAAIILILSLGVVGANLMLVIVINSRRYSKYIHEQPRYLLTSLASNDLAIGLLVTPFALVPSVHHCWPFGEIVCQIQALLRGALTQQSAVILICMAMDRYMCMLHPVRYHRHSSKKGCVAVISVTWVLCLSLFALLVLPRGGFYFNATGLLACDPFYSRASLRILASCCFYFPTTMILMYCYGSAFHVNKLRLKRAVAGCAQGHGHAPPLGQGQAQGHGHAPPLGQGHGLASPLGQGQAQGHSHTPRQQDSVKTPSTLSKQLVTHERRLSTVASRTMAAMSLGFIVMVTPWTIQEVVAACTGSKLPPFLDFFFTWLALSNSFWNPFLYWLLNRHFRRICRDIFLTKVLCRKQPPVTKEPHCCSSQQSLGAHNSHVSHHSHHSHHSHMSLHHSLCDRERGVDVLDRDWDRKLSDDAHDAGSSDEDNGSAADGGGVGSLSGGSSSGADSLNSSIARLAVPPPPRLQARPPMPPPPRPPRPSTSHPDLESLECSKLAPLATMAGLERTLSATSLTGLPPRIVPPQHLTHSYHHRHHVPHHHHHHHHHHHRTTTLCATRPNGSVPSGVLDSV